MRTGETTGEQAAGLPCLNYEHRTTTRKVPGKKNDCLLAIRKSSLLLTSVGSNLAMVGNMSIGDCDVAGTQGTHY